MIDDRVPAALREQLLTLPIEWRNAYFGPASTPGRWRAFPASAADASGVQTIAPRGLGLARSPLEPLRRCPAHAAELVSELRMGERVLRLDDVDGWWLVAGEDDYVGFARAWTLVAVEEAELAALQRRRLGGFAQPLGTLQPQQPAGDSTPLSLGVPLLEPDHPRHSAVRSGWAAVELVDGSVGALPNALIERDAPAGTTVECIRAACALLGCAYRWGGRSPFGFDCSGLVQLCYLVAGVQVPRDAAQQARWGQAVELDPGAWQVGDVLCFGQPADHVALWDGRALLHARARVRRDLPAHVPELMERLATVRRPGPLQAIARPSLWATVPRARAT